MDQTIKILSALAAALLVMTGAAAAPRPKPPIHKAPRAAPTAPAPDGPISPSAEAQRVADWIVASGDNRKLPYAVIDKAAASLILYDAAGEPLGQVPVLLGIAPGDEATPGVGSKTLGEIGPAEKTTPAGRFLAKFGYAAGRQKILWVDYTNSVAIHPIPADAARKERRSERMLSPTAEDNRITFGCINVPRAFYGNYIRPLFQRKGGYVYVLPDSRPIDDVFPRLRLYGAGARDQAS